MLCLALPAFFEPSSLVMTGRCIPRRAPRYVYPSAASAGGDSAITICSHIEHSLHLHPFIAHSLSDSLRPPLNLTMAAPHNTAVPTGPAVPTTLSSGADIAPPGASSHVTGSASTTTPPPERQPSFNTDSGGVGVGVGGGVGQTHGTEATGEHKDFLSQARDMAKPVSWC